VLVFCQAFDGNAELALRVLLKGMLFLPDLINNFAKKTYEGIET
jgi:hypothetical protein